VDNACFLLINACRGGQARGIRDIFEASSVEPGAAARLSAGEVCSACGAPISEASGVSTLCPRCQALAGPLPQPFPDYHLVRELGRGGMGVVYLARHLATGRDVALKMIRPKGGVEPEDVERFLREARILQQLDHPNIVAFRDMSEAEGKLYFAMDYVPGTDAAALLRRDGVLAVGRALDLTSQLLEGLAYAHARGFVRRDVKPGNLLVTRQGEREHAVALDFGLARTYPNGILPHPDRARDSLRLEHRWAQETRPAQPDAPPPAGGSQELKTRGRAVPHSPQFVPLPSLGSCGCSEFRQRLAVVLFRAEDVAVANQSGTLDDSGSLLFHGMGE
jgi:serine/threonine protein kinase